MPRSLASPSSWIPALLLIACGPATGTETSSGPEPTGSSTDPGSTSTPMTSEGSTTAPSDTTALTETGEVDTVGPMPDVPDTCSVFDQDCPEGFKCTPMASDGGASWNTTGCVPVAPDPSGPGEPCMVVDSPVSGLDDCDETSMCWDVDPETLMGVCTSYCIGDEASPTCPDPCDHCTITGDGALTICLAGCDPVAQDCPPGEGCYPADDAFACVSDASPPGAAVGSPCEFINVCPPGMFCVSPAAVPGCKGASGCCSPTCAVGEMDSCPDVLPGTECVPWYEGGLPPDSCLPGEPGLCAVPP